MKKLGMLLMLLMAMTMGSHRVFAQSVTITLMPGWNWISCPMMDTLDFETAMGSVTPVAGDIIKSRWGSATYTGEQWRGTISQFYPGYGYHYMSNRTMPVFLTFNAQQPTPQVIVTTMEPTDITAVSAISGGSLSSTDGSYIVVLEKGICWATHPNPMVMSDFFSENGSGAESFTALMTDLTPNSEYYVRAYVVTLDGTFYGEELSFTTSQLNNYTITVYANPTNGGTVTGGGTFQQGQSCTLTAIANNGYTFTNWTINGSVVSSNANYTFTVTGNRNLVANFITQPTVPIGAINGLFSVSATRQVYFSRGNLQYKASTNTWRFAEHQWDYVGTQTPDNNGNVGGTVNGSDNANISSNYSGWIDLFGWATSGFNHGANCYQPWSTSTSFSDYYAYGSHTYNLYDQTGQADWGYNWISNGGNQLNQWRTLTHNEWSYVFNYRTTSSGIRYAKARVNNVNGVILVPDDWNTSYYTLSNTNNSGASFTSNMITADQWSTLEQYGAAFLPAAGWRYGASVTVVDIYGFYWSASDYVSDRVWYVHFLDSGLHTQSATGRQYGQSVRLVAPAEN